MLFKVSHPIAHSQLQPSIGVESIVQINRLLYQKSVMTELIEKK